VLVCATAIGRLWALHLGLDGAELAADVAEFGASTTAVGPASKQITAWLREAEDVPAISAVPGEHPPRRTGVFVKYSVVMLTASVGRHTCGHGGQHQQQVRLTNGDIFIERFATSAATVDAADAFVEVKATHAAGNQKRIKQMKTNLLPGTQESWPVHLAATFVQNSTLSADIGRSGYERHSPLQEPPLQLPPEPPPSAAGERMRTLILTIQADFKQNPKCQDQYKRSQSGYFAVPTCAYHGFVLYLPDAGIRRTEFHGGNFYCDHWSNDKQKNSCWLQHAFEDLVKQNKDLFDQVAHVHLSAPRREVTPLARGVALCAVNLLLFAAFFYGRGGRLTARGGALQLGG
jgi:hypothetical protein